MVAEMVKSLPVTVTANQLIYDTRISINVDPTQDLVPFDVTIWGLLEGFVEGVWGPLDGQDVDIILNGVVLVTVKTALDGTYNVVYRLTEPGTYVFEVEFKGTQTLRGCPGHVTPNW